jgi:hypothetical protein
MITEKVEFEYVYGNLPAEELVPTLGLEETANFELEYTIYLLLQRVSTFYPSAYFSQALCLWFSLVGEVF